jgi:hypothetical protein
MDKFLLPVFLTENSTKFSKFSKFLTVNKIKTPHKVGFHPIPAMGVSLLWENREINKSSQLLHNILNLSSVYV